MKFAVGFLLAGLCCVGQTHQHNPPSNTAVDLDKLPKPIPIAGVGHSHLEIGAKSVEAQRWFDQGWALMHCFWDYEALRAFEEAVRLDPDCAMCHLGVYRALDFRGGAEEQAKAELEKAKELSPKASERDQKIVAAFGEAADKKSDSEAMPTAFAKLMQQYPDDVEISLLMASAISGGYAKGDPRPGAVYKQAMLRNILAAHPDNAAANHYWIHAVEASKHPEWALDEADRLARLAPGSSHMVHMPGHIFYRVGDYERARQSFLEAKLVDEKYMAAQHVAVADDWNYVHNISYLVADCAEGGRYAEADEHARSLVGTVDEKSIHTNPFFYVLQVGTTEARLAIRFADWDRVVAQPLQVSVMDEKLKAWTDGYRDGLIAYARGMKAGDQNRLDDLEGQSNILDATLWRLSQEKVDEKFKAEQDKVLQILGTASFELRGVLAAGRGELETARKLLTRADEGEVDVGYSEPPLYARPPLEVWGDLCLRAGRYADAREAFHRALEKRPKSGFDLYGIALAWDKEGYATKAGRAYREFLSAWSHADRDRPEVRNAEQRLGVFEGRSLPPSVSPSLDGRSGLRR